MADAVGADGDAGIAGAERQHEGFVDRLAAEDDAQVGVGDGGRRIEHQCNRRVLEFALAQQVVLHRHVPLLVVADQEAVAVGPRLEGDLAVAHDGLVARQLQQQRHALRVFTQRLLLARQRVERHQSQRDAQDDHHHQQFDQRETTLAGGAHKPGSPCDQLSQEPMSASSPVPPGAPSAP